MLEAHFAAVEAWQRQSLARVQDLRARLADGTREIDDYMGEQPGRAGYERVAEGDYRDSPANRRRRDTGGDVGRQRDEDEAHDEDDDPHDRGREEQQRDEQQAESTTRRSATRARRPRT